MQERARDLPWARERRWSLASHVWDEGAVRVIDLHDLDATLGRAVVRAVRDEPPPGGAVVFVHGVGRGSGPRGPVLVHVVRSELAGVGRLRTLSPGRTAWIHDPGVAPGWVQGDWGCATRALFLLLLALAVLALLASWWPRIG